MSARAGWDSSLDERFLRLRGNLGHGLEPKRQNTCTASLRQSQALLRAAIDIDLSVRPLTAFYGLEQAGSAYLAASNLGKGFSARGHGLSYSSESVKDAATIGDIVVTLDKPRDPEQGAFRMFASAYGVDLPQAASASLAQIWSSSIDRLEPLLSGRHLVRPLNVASSVVVEHGVRLVEVTDRYGMDVPFEQLAVDFGLTSAQAHVNEWQQRSRTFVLRDMSVLQHQRFAEAGSPPYLVPAAGTFGRLPSILNTWVLLYGLSVCARYLSGLWQLAINPDNSPDFLVLAHALGDLCSRLPGQIVDMLARVRL